ncbi:hypothetical protein MNBD_CHLOROFLEXI01-1389, partial [hydrothermal vent metagenome]
AALAVADGRVALITKRVEAKAMGKALKNYKSSNALIRDVVSNDEDPDKAIKKATQSAAEKALGRISGTVERKLGSDDLDAFNDFLLSIGRSIAEAAGEGILGIGKNTSDEESEALQSLASVLKATDKDKRDRRQAKQAAAQAKRTADAKVKATAKATAEAKSAAKAKAVADSKAKTEAAAKAKADAEKAKAAAAIQAKMKVDQRKRDMQAKARAKTATKERDERKAAAEAKAAEEAKAKAASKSRFTVFVAEHKVASGENLSVISQKYYNTQANWRFIYEANQDLIGDNPSLIRVGQLLKIPKL